MSATQRVSELPNENLLIVNCSAELAGRKNVITNHIQSAKHQAGKSRLVSKEAKEKDIAEVLIATGQQRHPVRETLPLDHRIYRVKVVKTFIRAAVPLSKLEIFRELLQENAYRLTDCRHMSDLVPLVLSQEVAQIKEEIADRPVSVVFDGTTRLGEAMAVVLRFVDSDFCMQQRLVRMQLLEKSVTREEIGRELINTLSVQYSVKPDLLLAAMHDRASTNDVALRTLKVVYPTVVDVGCISHTLYLVGEEFTTPHLNGFSTWWVSLFSPSPKARLLWKVQTGWPMPGYSPTRWWSKWELIKRVMELFGDIESFLRTNEDLAPATRGKLLGYFNDMQKYVYELKWQWLLM